MLKVQLVLQNVRKVMWIFFGQKDTIEYERRLKNLALDNLGPLKHMHC